jgi:hypothetical protein
MTNTTQAELRSGRVKATVPHLAGEGAPSSTSAKGLADIARHIMECHWTEHDSSTCLG